MTNPGQGWYPIHLYVPGFEDLGHMFPATDACVLRWLAQKAADKATGHPQFAEIGSFVGLTATILAEFGHVDCYDIWRDTGSSDPINELYRQHNVFRVFRQNIKRSDTPSNIADIFVQDHFHADCEWLLLHRKGKYDLIFIDASHEYADVKRDITEATKAIHPGGILCGHDYGFFSGVTDAVDEIGPDGITGSVWWKFL